MDVTKKSRFLCYAYTRLSASVLAWIRFTLATDKRYISTISPGPNRAVVRYPIQFIISFKIDDQFRSNLLLCPVNSVQYCYGF